MKTNRSAGYTGWIVRFLGTVSCALTIVTFFPQFAAAQEIEPNEFVPAPDGTNIALGYYRYGHYDSYDIAGFGKIKNSGVETNIGIARYVHYDYVYGLPAGVQILQAFGSESAAHIGDERLGSAFGASNISLSAFIWPYSNTDKKQYLVVAGFVDPPTGTYDKYSPVSLASVFGSDAILGDIQLGWDNAVGEHFSYDLGVDGRFYGGQTKPFGSRLSTNPDVRLQAWANWNWTRAFQVSIGWESILGGRQNTNGNFDGTTSQEERIRVAVSMFLAANAQVLLEFSHDFSAPGGFKQDFGLATRVLFVF